MALQFLISAVLMLTALGINTQLNKSSEKNPCNRKISDIGQDDPHIGKDSFSCEHGSLSDR